MFFRRRKIWVHVGLTKTASTYLQQQMSRNRDRLKLQGLHYPAYDERSNHFGLIRDAAPRDRLREDLEDAGRGGLVYSDENIFLMRPVEREFLQELKRLGQVRAILYLRNPWDWLASYYAQYVLQWEHRFKGSFGDFVEVMSPHLPYDAMVRTLKAEVDRIEVRSYEAAMSGTGMFADLLKVLGVNPKGFQEMREAHVSVPFAAIPTLRALNASCRIPMAEHRALETMIRGADLSRRIGFATEEDLARIGELFQNDSYARSFGYAGPGFDASDGSEDLIQGLELVAAATQRLPVASAAAAKMLSRI